jgi:hypothetical protein
LLEHALESHAMRVMPSIAAAAFLMAAALPAISHADGMPPRTAPRCHCPQAVRHVVWHAHRGLRYRRRMAWHRAPHPRLALAPPFPIYFTWVVPSPVQPGYDRAMVLIGRSPGVSGIYKDDPGVPVTPMVAGDAPYQYAAGGGAAFQYDTMTGEYIQLSREDMTRATPGLASPPR